MRIVVAAILLLATAAAQAQDFERSAPLGTDQVPGTLVGDVTNATGSAAVSFDDATATLSWQIVFDGLTGPISVAHIHGPAPLGSDAGVLVDLVANSTGSTSPMIGSVVIDAATATAIRDDMSYVNLHTMMNGGGEIRGQLVALDDFAVSARMDADQALNNPTAPEAARGSGGFDYDAASQELSWDIVYKDLSGPLTVAHIHGPATADQTAGVLVDLLAGAIDDGARITGRASVDTATASFVRDGFGYANLHTQTNQGGEVRGQLLPLMDFDVIAVLDTEQATNNPTGAPDAIGGGGFSYAADTGELSWEIAYANLTGPLSAAHIHGPAARGEPASVLVELLANSTDDGSSLAGRVVVDDTATVGFVRDGLSYANLHTMANGGGEIRGQLEPLEDFDRVAVINTDQVVGALNGMVDEAIGAAGLTYDRDSNTLSWEIHFFKLTGDPTAAHIHGPAAAGDNAGVLINLLANSAGSTSPVIGSTDTVDVATLGYIAASMSYINIHTMMNQGGELRGQIVPIIDTTLEANITPDQVNGPLVGDTSGASGRGTLQITAADLSVSWDVSYSGLTSPVTVAHVHGPATPDMDAGVLIDIAPSGVDSPLQGSAQVPPITIADLLAGLTYVNIHTQDNGGGEIRGQVGPIVFADGFETD